MWTQAWTVICEHRHGWAHVNTGMGGHMWTQAWVGTCEHRYEQAHVNTGMGGHMWRQAWVDTCEHRHGWTHVNTGMSRWTHVNTGMSGLIWTQAWLKSHVNTGMGGHMWYTDMSDTCEHQHEQIHVNTGMGGHMWTQAWVDTCEHRISFSVMHWSLIVHRHLVDIQLYTVHETWCRSTKKQHKIQISAFGCHHHRYLVLHYLLQDFNRDKWRMNPSFSRRQRNPKCSRHFAESFIQRPHFRCVMPWSYNFFSVRMDPLSLSTTRPFLSFWN